MIELATSKYTLDLQPSYPLQALVTKYSPKTEPDSGSTLILFHALGTHKETWEITVQRLFELSASRDQRFKIRDVFSIENPNHGESAVLNEQAINEHFKDDWPTRITAKAAHIFLTAGLSGGAKIDFSQRNLIGIGHSIGAATLFLMRDLTPRVHFETIIAIEPGISLKSFPETISSYQMVMAWTWLRNDVWLSRSAAKKEFSTNRVYQSWDPRTLDLYLRYGLRSHPAKKYPAPFTFNGVTTSLTKEQEAACYRSDHVAVDALDAYAATSREVPVHILWGKGLGIATPGQHGVLSDAKAGRTPASVTHVDGVGHLMVQQQPEKVADLIFSILSPPSIKAQL